VCPAAFSVAIVVVAAQSGAGIRSKTPGTGDGYVARLLREAGLTPARARRRAVLAYAAYLGHAQLVLTTPGVLPRSDRARRAYVDEIADVLLTRVLRVRAGVVPGVLGA
jgi:hypothetical protein